MISDTKTIRPHCRKAKTPCVLSAGLSGHGWVQPARNKLHPDKMKRYSFLNQHLHRKLQLIIRLCLGLRHECGRPGLRPAAFSSVRSTTLAEEQRGGVQRPGISWHSVWERRRRTGLGFCLGPFPSHITQHNYTLPGEGERLSQNILTQLLHFRRLEGQYVDKFNVI